MQGGGIKKKKGVETHLSLDTSSWVFDTRYGSQLCNMLQGMERRRKLEEGDMILRLDNGVRVATHSIGVITLAFYPNKIILDPVYYIPSLIKNIIFHFGS